MKLLIFGALNLLFLLSYSQNMRVTLSNNVFIVLVNNANLVLGNPNSNAITVLGSGGNIVSENETDYIKWNILNSTGNYTIPFTTKNGVKIPTTLNIANAGSNDGYIRFSTHTDNNNTNSWNNSDYKPTGVTNMYGKNGQNNNSANVIDRFWTIDQEGYATNPKGTITLAYDDNERTAAGNTIAAGTLVGQYWNESNNRWYYQTLTGTDNYPTKTVSGIQTDVNFYKNWTLASTNNPLPIELTQFEGINVNEYNHITWETETEIDNDYFTLERSTDTQNWTEIAIVEGAGNSTQTIKYEYKDYNIKNNTVYYYKLKQTDFNGEHTSSDLIVIKTDKQNNLSVYPNPSSGVFNLYSEEAVLNYSILDLSGKVIQQKIGNYKKVNLNQLPKGVYILRINTVNNNYIKRLILK